MIVCVLLLFVIGLLIVLRSFLYASLCAVGLLLAWFGLATCFVLGLILVCYWLALGLLY